METERYQTDKNLKWIYPWVQEPPRGVKLALLTLGDVQVSGVWRDDGSCKAWQKLFKRDKEAERSEAARDYTERYAHKKRARL